MHNGNDIALIFGLRVFLSCNYEMVIRTRLVFARYVFLNPGDHCDQAAAFSRIAPVSVRFNLLFQTFIHELRPPPGKPPKDNGLVAPKRNLQLDNLLPHLSF